mmetsp:Transcript_71079/g.141229  ORF Transcript_71079/g.141229 Transcript_71079/m.141229 type:complete len:225 (-) Transcript_71079:91-765(-)
MPASSSGSPPCRRGRLLHRPAKTAWLLVGIETVTATICHDVGLRQAAFAPVIAKVVYLGDALVASIHSICLCAIAGSQTSVLQWVLEGVRSQTPTLCQAVELLQCHRQSRAVFTHTNTGALPCPEVCKIRPQKPFTLASFQFPRGVKLEPLGAGANILKQTELLNCKVTKASDANRVSLCSIAVEVCIAATIKEHNLSSPLKAVCVPVKPCLDVHRVSMAGCQQ